MYSVENAQGRRVKAAIILLDIDHKIVVVNPLRRLASS